MRVFIICLLLSFALAAAGLAQEGEGLMLYNGDAEKNSGGIRLSSWGSGYVAESYDVHYIGPRVLRVLSHGYYQGAVLSFEKPVPLARYLANRNGYLEIFVKPALVPPPPEEVLDLSAAGASSRRGSGRGGAGGGAARMGGGGGGAARMGGGTGGGGASTGGGGRMGGFRPGAARTGGGGGPAAGAVRGRTGGAAGTGRQAAAAKAKDESKPGTPDFIMQQMRLILVTDKGVLLADDWPIASAALIPGGWNQVAIPLSAFKSASPQTGGVLKEIRLFADRADVFYIGRMVLRIDEQPMRIDIAADPKEATTGAKIKFYADIATGNALAMINWDFDETDGIQVEAQGPVVEWFYKKPGQYTVTCTAEDLYGGKQPVTTKLTVTVTGAEML